MLKNSLKNITVSRGFLYTCQGVDHKFCACCQQGKPYCDFHVTYNKPVGFCKACKKKMYKKMKEVMKEGIEE